MPILRREVSPTAIVVLKETEAVENVNDESDGRKLYVDPSTRLSGSVVVEGHVHSTPDFQLKVKIWRHSNKAKPSHSMLYTGLCVQHRQAGSVWLACEASYNNY